MIGYEPGDVVWVDFGATVGREQSGGRPAVVVAAGAHARIARDLTIVVPCTTRNRGWMSHVRLAGAVDVDRPTFAMTEQPRAISYDRVQGRMGAVDERCRRRIGLMVRGWLVQPPLFGR